MESSKFIIPAYTPPGERCCYTYNKNSMNFYWTENDVLAKLEDIMTKAFAETWEKKQELQTSLRMGAYALAVKRVTKAMEERGRA